MKRIEKAERLQSHTRKSGLTNASCRLCLRGSYKLYNDLEMRTSSYKSLKIFFFFFWKCEEDLSISIKSHSCSSRHMALVSRATESTLNPSPFSIEPWKVERSMVDE